MTHIVSESQVKSARVSNSVKMAVLVRALRNAFGMSQEYLAKLAGSSRPTINRIETMDKRSPRANTLEDLLRVFQAMGVEVTIFDEEVNIRFTKNAMIAAGNTMGLNAVLEHNEKEEQLQERMARMVREYQNEMDAMRQAEQSATPEAEKD
ncbi:MAG: hypothetical protein A3J49_17945 [Gallionellales bacterium RIFCSPHIGHO2_02_FULL_57_16]|nr:MAG: hypothetical protein A3J49_17945 [Gallionellales bacterium RIFCSPHIGHO2_02_FULL_57_16]